MGVDISVVKLTKESMNNLCSIIQQHGDLVSSKGTLDIPNNVCHIESGLIALDTLVDIVLKRDN